MSEKKPIIIYTMKRTHGSAALEACKRTYKIWEPFNLYNFFDFVPESGSTPKQRIDQYKLFFDQIHPLLTSKFIEEDSYLKLESILSSILTEDTASKILPQDFVYFYHLDKWFKNIISTDKAIIFVLLRNSLRDQFLSDILAHRFGYMKNTETKPFKFEANNQDILNCRKHLETFLRFFPEKGKIITFDSLPNEYFDTSLIKIKNQNSLKNINFISNIEWLEYHIDNIIKYYKEEYENKISSITTH